jgi:hypothetical protein
MESRCTLLAVDFLSYNGTRKCRERVYKMRRRRSDRKRNNAREQCNPMQGKARQGKISQEDKKSDQGWLLCSDWARNLGHDGESEKKKKRNRDTIRQDDPIHPAKEKGVCIGNVCVSTINARYQGKARQGKTGW